MSVTNDYSTTALVSNVLLIAHVPLSNSTFNPAQIVNLASRELQTAIMKQILSVRQGYYLTYEDFTPTQDGLYPIPPNAIAGALENIEIVQSPSIIQVNIVEESEQFATNASTATSYGFFMRGNNIQILPYPTNTVRVWYSRRPSVLVPTLNAGLVTAIAGPVISLATVPSTFLVTQSVDLVEAQPTFEYLGTRTITNVSLTDITLDSDVTGLAVGDWMAIENQTPIPQIPVEFRPLLEQRVVVKIYELQGYLDKMKAAQEKLSELERDLFSLISPRVKSQSKIINPQNGGFLGGANTWGRFPTGNSNGSP